MVDYVADYLENIRGRRPLSNVKPGYLRELIPDEAPRDPEPWDDLFRDIERVIMPGVSTQGEPSGKRSQTQTRVCTTDHLTSSIVLCLCQVAKPVREKKSPHWKTFRPCEVFFIPVLDY